ncbi:MAG: SUF system NifU family Fe-S cluster assembly protein [Cryobacterium sp.]|uniref:Fe-S cluster assembly sulfur transfer protein SufU n=1 Tax=unclassified Cryobacterium TaxID=2649013 RepID=UPI0018C9FBBA|nr:MULTISPECIES: SUF system NifU family Fe-S cluster assembly protein [unclassified Cryobacterium]MCY7403459.1 SUF system NifU family Fe-S cluster assembly protein [Cryobacterium sp.]MEC5152740.1 nitrogen fixation NifU-like protein [Cryobacterium sp. CAN_C3]
MSTNVATGTSMAGLYQEMIIEHAHSPRNLRQLEGAHQTIEALNPLCGDHLTLYVQRDGDRIADIAFEGDGCAISKASASLMTSAVKGLQTDEAFALFRRVHTMLTTKPEGAGPPDGVGKLAVLSGVWEYPARVKCATLSWQALHSALKEGAPHEGAVRGGAPMTGDLQNGTE